MRAPLLLVSTMLVLGACAEEMVADPPPRATGRGALAAAPTAEGEDPASTASIDALLAGNQYDPPPATDVTVARARAPGARPPQPTEQRIDEIRSACTQNDADACAAIDASHGCRSRIASDCVLAHDIFAKGRGTVSANPRLAAPYAYWACEYDWKFCLLGRPVHSLSDPYVPAIPNL